MGRIFSKEQKEEFKDILETLGESLDITQTQYDNLTRSYKAVGEFLQNDPVFEPYKPIVSPQGSLRGCVKIDTPSFLSPFISSVT